MSSSPRTPLLLRIRSRLLASIGFLVAVTLLTVSLFLDSYLSRIQYTAWRSEAKC